MFQMTLKTWRGFKGRVFSYDPTDSGETGNSIFYRKSYTLGEDVLIELKSLKRELKKEFENLKKPLDFIESGVDAAIITELFSSLEKNISGSEKSKLELIDDIWDVTEEEIWDKNPRRYRWSGTFKTTKLFTYSCRIRS
ncbi:Uncharacterised protein [Raoultella ornithinolytica]|nr:Uncharacterised protein [Raoultella ornithinolytica]